MAPRRWLPRDTRLPRPIHSWHHGAAGRCGGVYHLVGDRHWCDPAAGDHRQAFGALVAIFTEMLLLPVLMSYAGISPRGLREQEKRADSSWPIFRRLSAVVEPRAWRCR
ncbi:hypothetical protein ACU8WE_30430 [Pseudomonas parakoreensis]